MSDTSREEETLGAVHEGDSNPAEKDPSDWVTGDEPMTAPQRSYLDTLAREAGEEIPADLTKAEASEQIDRLQNETGRSTQ
ncbi:transposase [Microbacterium sp. SUBG005]|nr:transposase [Microbacterium sp. SUBG005]